MECTKDNPASESKELIVHVDAEETGNETESLVEYVCPNCGVVFWLDLGD